MKTLKQKIVIIYHSGCRDGFGGAWAAWKKFKNKAAYIPAFDRSGPPYEFKGKEIYLIDYTYRPEVIKKLIKDGNHVTAIDHHISAKKAVKLTEQYSFSLNHSGAVLAWNYFHPGRKVPVLLRCVEDGDLWKWRLPWSKEILAAMNLKGFDFAAWGSIAKELEIGKKRKIFVEQGRLLLRYEECLLNELLPNAGLVDFLGHKVFAINAPHHFTDDLGNALAKKLHSFAIVWYAAGGKINVSLRSEGSVDVSKIAVKFNGGGHKRSAAFSFDAKRRFPWKLIDTLR